jgi:hypothetical protein
MCQTQLEKSSFINSAKYFKSLKININEYKSYIEDYLKNKIDANFLVYLVLEGYIKLTEDDKERIIYVMQNYRNIVLDIR